MSSPASMLTPTAATTPSNQEIALALVRRLVDGGSEIGFELERSLDTPLRDYLRSYFPAPQTSYNVHRARLAASVEWYLRDHGEREVDEICDHLLKVPVIQQADHSNLLLDVEVFLNNWLFHLGGVEAGVKYVLTSQCSTVSCLSRRTPPLGPTFLRSRATLFGVVPLSRTALKGSTFCSLPELMTVTLDVLDGEWDVASDPVLGPLVGRRLVTPTRGYRECNDEIWRGLSVDHNVRRVQIDEAVAADCVARHLEDPDGPLARLLFDPPVRDAFLAAKRRLVADESNLAVNRAAPDFLWVRRGTRLHQVALEGSGSTARWYVETDGADLPMPVERATIAHALRDGTLYPDRILAYLVRCLLPGVVAVGGSSQQDYLKLYRRMLLDAHEQVPFLDDDLVEQLRSAKLSGLGGRPLVEPIGEAWDAIRFIGPQTDMAGLAAIYLDSPLRETIGKLRCVGHLTRRID